jgi:hypothetical protein
MARLISFPFRIAEYGAAANNEQGDDEYYREQLATIVLTKRGEREMDEDLGMPDIAYSGFLYSAFQSQIAEEFPEIIKLKAGIENVDMVTEAVVIEFGLTEEA